MELANGRPRPAALVVAIVELMRELRFPHSLRLLVLGVYVFRRFQGQLGGYKLMGLRRYGEPRFADCILSRLVDLKEDGSFRMDMTYFRYCEGLQMTSRSLRSCSKGRHGCPRRP